MIASGPDRPDAAGEAGAWPDRAGGLVSCPEKRRVLAENEAELHQTLRDAFDDAVLIGVDERWLRDRLHRMVDGLESPLGS